jgi:hypothetical protein
VILWPEDIDERLRAAKSQTILSNDASVPVPHAGDKLVRLFRHGWLSRMRHRYGIRHIPALFLAGHGAGMRRYEISLGWFVLGFMSIVVLCMFGLAVCLNAVFDWVA